MIDPGMVQTTGTDAATRMTVDVMIGGRGPFSFVVDTAAQRTVISSELASELGLAPAPPVLLDSLSERRSTPMVVIPILSVNGRVIENIHAPAIAQGDIGALGILGVDSLKGQQLVMDFRRKTMVMEMERPRRGRRTTEAEVVVPMAKRLGQLVIADADVAGRTVHVVLDTGSEVSIGNGALATWLGRTQADDGARFTLVSVTGGKVAARAMSMPALRLGTVRLRGMQIAIADAHIFRQLGLDNRPALLLGMDALRSFDRVSIDLAKGRVSLTLPGKDVTDQPSRLAFKG